MIVWFRRAWSPTLLLPTALAVAVTVSAGPPARHPAGRGRGSASFTRVFAVDLPSAATGVPGGTLALRVDAPVRGRELLEEGAPVAVVLPGGFSPGSLRPLAPDLLGGVVVISFLDPGGCDGDRCSAGSYDHRGPASVEAAADVLRFAMGLAADGLGRTIDQVTGIRVLHDDVGLVALSNGGAMAMAVMAEYGAGLPGLRWFVGWENPGNAQCVTVDAGPGENLFCPGPSGARVTFPNPWYAYAQPSLDIDYGAVAYDPAMDALFLDGNGNGRFDLRRRPDGCLDPDLDGDGSIGPGEDYGLGTAFGDAGPFRHYSRELTRAVWDRGVFSSPPEWLETPEASAEFWELRDEARLIPAAAAAVPGLETILVASLRDHVQTQPDHPHVRVVFDGLLANGMWVKLNPSPATVLELAPDVADLAFRPDPGIRVDTASNPMPAVAEDGSVVLYYNDRSVSPPRTLVTSSEDGLAFPPGHVPDGWADDPRRVLLPGGTWRRYLVEREDPENPGGAMVLRSESSADGVDFARDEGVRYRPAEADNGSIGVYDTFVDGDGGTVILYLGDMGGSTASVRRAYSPAGDGGWTFHFEGDVLGRFGAGEGHNYVDPRSLPLPDGRRRLFTMYQGPQPPLPGVRAVGRIASFITTDGGRSFELEDGWRLQPEDFSDFQVWSLNDPWVVRLPDGRCRMYVAALVTDGGGNARSAIVSATADGTALPDLPPGTAPDDWTSSDWTYPESVPNEVMQAAAVVELARRAAAR